MDIFIVKYWICCNRFKCRKITKSIYETLDKSPELFWYKTKGILLSTEECEILDRGRVRISLDNADYEGIMDGGHNTFAIARFIIDKLYGISFKTWDECKKFWDENYDNVLERFEQVKEQFKFSIPIEILSPSDEIGALDEFYDYISEICSARNNNVQLRETAKGNQVGYYEYLKDKLYDYKIIWKTGSIGKIKAEDVISLATLPLLFLQDKGLLPQDIKTLNKISIYSQKSKCVDYFNEVLAHSAVSEGEKGKYILKNEIKHHGIYLPHDFLFVFIIFHQISKPTQKWIKITMRILIFSFFFNCTKWNIIIFNFHFTNTTKFSMTSTI